MAHASHESHESAEPASALPPADVFSSSKPGISQAAVLPPVDGRNYQFTLNERKAMGAGQSGKTEGGSANGAAKPGTSAAELSLNPFFTLDSPSSPAAHGGANAEKLKVNTSVTIEPAGKTQSESLGKPAAESPSSSVAAGSGPKPESSFVWGGSLPSSAPPGGSAKPTASAAAEGPKPDKSAAESPLHASFTADLPVTPGAPGGGKPAKVHVEASVDIEPSGPGAGAADPSGPKPSQLTEMQKLQEMQRQNLEQQAQMQNLNMQMQIQTALMSAEMNLNSARVSFIKQAGEAIKHAAP